MDYLSIGCERGLKGKRGRDTPNPDGKGFRALVGMNEKILPGTAREASTQRYEKKTLTKEG